MHQNSYEIELPLSQKEINKILLCLLLIGNFLNVDKLNK